MGLREFWQKLTSGDSVDSELEDVRDHPDGEPHQQEDFEGMKGDRMLDERFRGTDWMDEDLKR
jgi:hypothetical protein